MLLVLFLPSTMWLILETSTINSKKLTIYGPRKVIGANDTSYFKVNDQFYLLNKKDSAQPTPINIEPDTYPLYAVMFIKNAYKKNDLRLSGLWEFLNYKKQKIEHIPIVLVTEEENGRSEIENDLKALTV